MFADPGQVAGFAALMSDEDKPFECVGERRESAAALRMLSEPTGVAGVAGGGRPGRPGPGHGVGRRRRDAPDPGADLAFPDPDVADGGRPVRGRCRP